MRTNDQNRLLPYLENQLDTTSQAQIAVRLADDPVLAAEAKRLRRTVDSLRQAAARRPSPKMTDHWPALQARLILAPAPRRTPGWAWWASGAALAAVLSAAFAVFWLPEHNAHRAMRAAALPAAAPAPISVPVPAAGVMPALPKAEVKAEVKPVKAAAPKLLMRTHYDPLTTPHTLPFPQADPFASPPAKPLFKPRPPLRARPRLLFRRLKPAPKQKPVAPLISAGKPPPAPHSATAPSLAVPDVTPPPAAPASPPDPIPAGPAASGDKR